MADRRRESATDSSSRRRSGGWPGSPASPSTDPASPMSAADQQRVPGQLANDVPTQTEPSMTPVGRFSR